MEWLYTRLGKVLVDAICLCLALTAGYLIRFDGDFPPNYLSQAFGVSPYVIILTLGALGVQGTYARVWRYTNLTDTALLLAAMSVPIGLLIVLRATVPDPWMMFRLPFSVIATYFSIGFLLTAGSRAVRRLVYERRKRTSQAASPVLLRRLLVVGAGDTGIRLARDFAHRGDCRVVAFVDDDLRKARTRIAGVRVRGTTADVARLVVALRIDEVVVACAMADGALRELMNVCDEIPVRMRALAPVNDVAGHVSGRLRDLRIEDLLPRKVATFDAAGPTVVDTYRGRRVMVTGAGGSIGSELARQLVRLEPSALLLLDHDENNLFETCSDVMHLGWPADRVADLMIDLRRPDDLRRVFAEQQPEVVLHAAAFKHVPVLEAHPLEAVENNVLATANLADLAMEFGVRTFVLISTDKAVQPTSIMGATKRAAELVIEQAAVGGLPASCVRFGNVLDSRGSVVPIFRRQIARGGPVTVTHRDATRYFMTIDEAAHLVLQAGSLDGTGRVFVLDMGAPVRIVDLAGDLIRLAGLREPEDIEIQVVGLRPGERLHERLTYDGTELTPTIFEGILAAPASAVGLETSMRLRSALRDAVVYRDEALARRVLAAEPIGMETEGAAEVVVDPARMRVAGVAVW